MLDRVPREAVVCAQAQQRYGRLKGRHDDARESRVGTAHQLVQVRDALEQAERGRGQRPLAVAHHDLLVEREMGDLVRLLEKRRPEIPAELLEDGNVQQLPLQGKRG